MIGIIGAGNMGGAIALSLKQKVIVSDKDSSRKKALKSRKVLFTKDNKELAGRAEVIIIAVKPQEIKELLNGIKPFTENKLIITIAAGIETRIIEKYLAQKARVVRVMPNMGLACGKGISAVCKGRFARKSDIRKAVDIFSKSGEVVEVKEKDMDAVTAVSGSGPAYYFIFTDMLERAALSCGLDGKIAKKLALMTFAGSAACAEESCISLKELAGTITSKGGTTEAALKVFKKKNLDKTLKMAVKSARDRSRRLRRLCWEK